MSIKSVFVIHKDGETIITKHFGDKTARSVADLFWANVIKYANREDVPCVIDAGRHLLVHIQRDELYFLAIVSNDCQVLMVIDFLDRVYNVFRDYFKTVTNVSLKAHFPTVYQLLDEMMDYGIPFTTELNNLQDIVGKSDVLGNLAASILGQSLVAKELPGAAAEVDWRRRLVKYRQNEMFVDVVEKLHMVIESNGSVISAEVAGEFLCDCRLSGMPDLTMHFNRAQLMEDIALHRCVRHKAWEKSKQISFVPPDGKFSLLSFRSKGQIELPIRVEHSIRFAGTGGTVSVRITSHDVGSKPVSDVRVELRFAKVISTATLSANCGTVVFDDTLKRCVWEAGTIKAGLTFELSGTVLLPKDVECENPELLLDFTQQGWTPSGLKVSELAVHRAAYTPFKGVRYIAKGGNIVIRT